MLYAKSRIKTELYNYAKNNRGYENIDKRTKTWLKRLQERSRNKEVVIFPTDKSAKLAIDTPSNYVSIMEKHLEGAQEVSAEDHNQIETVLNAYMKSWFLILQGNSRLRNNFISRNNDVAPLYGLRKDHKSMDNEVLGPPT